MTSKKPVIRRFSQLLGAEAKLQPSCIRCGGPRGVTARTDRLWAYCPTCKS